MMMSKTETMPAMMAWRIEPMPLTMAIKQAPIDWKTARICCARDFISVFFSLSFLFSREEMVMDVKQG